MKKLFQWGVAAVLLCSILPKIEVEIRYRYIAPKKTENLKTESATESDNKGIVETARTLIGTPYKFGGTSLKSGIDCSFFTQLVFKKNGINLPRTASEQFYTGTKVKEPQSGDLVFFHTNWSRFVSHVGIMVDKQTFIHASSQGGGVTIDSLSEDYYRTRLIEIRRII